MTGAGKRGPITKRADEPEPGKVIYTKIGDSEMITVAPHRHTMVTVTYGSLGLMDNTNA